MREARRVAGWGSRMKPKNAPTDWPKVIERLAETFHAYPVFERSEWKPAQALSASEALARLPKRDQETAVEMISERYVPPDTAVRILEGLAGKRAKDRKAVLDLYRSEDPAKRSLGMTNAAGVPPMPPATLTLLRVSIEKAEKALGVAFTTGGEELRSIVARLEAVLEENEKKYQTLREKEGWPTTR